MGGRILSPLIPHGECFAQSYSRQILKKYHSFLADYLIVGESERPKKSQYIFLLIIFGMRKFCF